MRSPMMKSGGLKLLTTFAFVMVACVVAVAESDNYGTKQKEVLTTLEQRMLKRISIDFRNTPIEDVIRVMAEQADVDIVKSPSVTGNVTAKLTNVPLKEALDNILTTHGYAYVASENMIRVAPVDEITEKAERLDHKIYRVTYADVSEVEQALKKFISKRGSISSNTGTSNIIVTDTETKIKAIDTFIDEIDRITPQILVEARIYDISAKEGFDLSPDWDAGRNNPITVFSTNTRTSAINNLTGATTSDTTATVKTTETAWQGNTAGTGTTGYTYRKSDPFVGGMFDYSTGGKIRVGFLDTVNIDFALSILSNEVNAELLANPRILVLDNETARFEIISEIPYTEQSSTSEGGAMTSIKFKEVGVKLQVTPHVTRDGMIRLHILPEFGVVTEEGSKTATANLGTVPTVDNRKVDTIALVKDDQTVVLGGLRKKEVSQKVYKVPILGDVPLLGGIFKDIDESVKTTELLIFITPKIIVSPTLSPSEREQFQKTKVTSPEELKLTIK